MGCGEESTGWRNDAASRTGRNAAGRDASRTSECEWHSGTGPGRASRLRFDIEIGAASGVAGACGGWVEYDEALSAGWRYQISAIRKREEAISDQRSGTKKKITQRRRERREEGAKTSSELKFSWVLMTDY